MLFAMSVRLFVPGVVMAECGAQGVNSNILTGSIVAGLLLWMMLYL
jgi:hypothetical protein